MSWVKFLIHFFYVFLASSASIGEAITPENKPASRGLINWLDSRMPATVGFVASIELRLVELNRRQGTEEITRVHGHREFTEFHFDISAMAF